jgi:hypothetical protein
MLVFIFSFLATHLFASESFRLIIYDRKVEIQAPATQGRQYSAIVENKSLSDVVAKFHAGGKDLKFISVKASSSKTVEFQHTPNQTVFFKMLNPAFQEFALEAGKKTYEVPSE